MVWSMFCRVSVTSVSIATHAAHAAAAMSWDTGPPASTASRNAAKVSLWASISSLLILWLGAVVPCLYRSRLAAGGRPLRVAIAAHTAKLPAVFNDGYHLTPAKGTLCLGLHGRFLLSYAANRLTASGKVKPSTSMSQSTALNFRSQTGHHALPVLLRNTRLGRLSS